MRQNGAMFICNRCRKQVFAERFDDGVFDQKALDGWALEMRNIHGIGDLCPECYKVYRETMNVFMKVADMEDKTDNSKKKEEHDSLKPARDAIATAMRAAQFAKATGTPLPKPLKWQREFYDATGVFPYGWYECPVCGYRTDWEPHACPICHTLLEP